MSNIVEIVRTRFATFSKFAFFVCLRHILPLSCYLFWTNSYPFILLFCRYIFGFTQTTSSVACAVRGANNSRSKRSGSLIWDIDIDEGIDEIEDGRGKERKGRDTHLKWLNSYYNYSSSDGFLCRMYIGCFGSRIGNTDTDRIVLYRMHWTIYTALQGSTRYRTVIICFANRDKRNFKL